MQKRILVRTAFAVWVALWLIFLVRPYFKNELLKEYRALASLSVDDRRAFVTGRDLYDFIKFCNAAMPAASSYRLIGLEERPLDERRLIYYLYPNAEAPLPEFLLVYGVKNFSEKNYAMFKSMDSQKYILKKIK